MGKIKYMLGAVSALAVGFASMSIAMEPSKEAVKAAAEKKKDDQKADEKKPLAPGAKAPDFTLTDTDGKTHKLSDILKDGNKLVVLQWFNPDCPFVVMHFKETKTFNDMHANYKDKGVVFFWINSGAPGKQGAGKERNVKAKKDWSIPYPILLDEKGDVGRAYNAKRTPDTVVINKDGVVAYMGAPDDAVGTEIGKTNYVTKALDELLSGSHVTTTTMRGYGCTVKY